MTKSLILLLALCSTGCITTGEPPFIHAESTRLTADDAVDCVIRKLATGDYLLTNVDRGSHLLKARRQWRGGQFGVRDFVDVLTITAFEDEQRRTILRVAVTTTVDSKPVEPSERGVAAAKALVRSCAQ